MATFSSVYGGSYLTGKEVAGKTVRVRISSIDLESVGDPPEKKLVAKFEGAEKGLVLNSTNANCLANAFGDHPEQCIGKLVELFTVPVNFNGQVFDGIRLRPVDEPQPAAPQPTEQLAVADYDASIPF